MPCIIQSPFVYNLGMLLYGFSLTSLNDVQNICDESYQSSFIIIIVEKCSYIPVLYIRNINTVVQASSHDGSIAGQSFDLL